MKSFFGNFLIQYFINSLPKFHKKFFFQFLHYGIFKSCFHNFTLRNLPKINIEKYQNLHVFVDKINESTFF